MEAIDGPNGHRFIITIDRRNPDDERHAERRLQQLTDRGKVPPAFAVRWTHLSDRRWEARLLLGRD
jgi:hypothetical protein